MSPTGPPSLVSPVLSPVTHSAARPNCAPQDVDLGNGYATAVVNHHHHHHHHLSHHQQHHHQSGHHSEHHQHMHQGRHRESLPEIVLERQASQQSLRDRRKPSLTPLTERALAASYDRCDASEAAEAEASELLVASANSRRPGSAPAVLTPDHGQLQDFDTDEPFAPGVAMQWSGLRQRGQARRDADEAMVGKPLPPAVGTPSTVGGGVLSTPVQGLEFRFPSVSPSPAMHPQGCASGSLAADLEQGHGDSMHEADSPQVMVEMHHSTMGHGTPISHSTSMGHATTMQQEPLQREDEVSCVVQLRAQQQFLATQLRALQAQEMQLMHRNQQQQQQQQEAEAMGYGVDTGMMLEHGQMLGGALRPPAGVLGPEGIVPVGMVTIQQQDAYGAVHVSQGVIDGGNMTIAPLHGGETYLVPPAEHPSPPPRPRSHSTRGQQIMQMVDEQGGTRYLLKALEDGDEEERDQVFADVYDSVLALSTEPGAIHLLSKTMECCSEQQMTMLVQRICDNIGTVGVHATGARIVQRMIEGLQTPEQVATFVQAVTPQVVALVKDVNGNHVIQKCLQKLDRRDAQFVYDTIAPQVAEVATHRNGCCILQRCIDFGSDEQRLQLVDHIISHGLQLVQDPFGNYVVQYIIDMEMSYVNARLIRNFLGHFAQLSTNKFSSNVVEKCLRMAPQAEKDEMVQELVNPCKLQRLLQDQYANYVIQTALNTASSAQFRVLADAIRPIIHTVRNTPAGKKIEQKINRGPGPEPQNNQHNQKQWSQGGGGGQGRDAGRHRRSRGQNPQGSDDGFGSSWQPGWSITVGGGGCSTSNGAAAGGWGNPRPSRGGSRSGGGGGRGGRGAPPPPPNRPYTNGGGSWGSWSYSDTPVNSTLNAEAASFTPGHYGHAAQW